MVEFGSGARAVAEELGRRVRDRRKAVGVSQEKLGELAQLHRTYIGQVERGEVNMTFRNLLLIAGALGVDAGELVAGIVLEDFS